MELEQVLSDRDSEDEVDDGVADLEDKRVCSIVMLLSSHFYWPFFPSFFPGLFLK